MAHGPTALDGSPRAAALPEQVVARRYRLLHPLKAGGMGSVYVAEHLATGRRVALKLMHPGLVTNAAARQRFETEARVGAAIQSRHVVDVLDAGVDGALFVVAYQQGWFTDDEREPERDAARPRSTAVAPAVPPEPQPKTPFSPAADEPPLPGMVVRYRSPSDCPGTRWVQVGVPAAATPDSYEFPLTHKVVAGRRTLAGSCFVMARGSSGQRIFGGVVSDESTGRLLLKLLDDELGPSGRSVQTRAGIQPIYGTFFVDEGGAVRSFAVP